MSNSNTKTDYFSSNCREELTGHISCVKLFLEDHVKYGTEYSPGSGGPNDHCAPTRDLYMRCMKNRRENPVTPQQAASTMAFSEGPKLCEMELALHGNCVGLQLERTQKLGEKYWTQGGEDKCKTTRSNYEKCMRLSKEGRTDRWGGYEHSISHEMEKSMAHLTS